MTVRVTPIKAVVLAALCVALTACTSLYRNHGYTPSEDDLAEIVVGVDTRGSVEEVVGQPSTTGVLRDSGWYYVSSRVRTFAYRAPEVVDRQLVAISFDEAGVVTNIERFTLEDGQVVPLARRVTDSSVRDTTFLRQLLGNLGRFDPSTFLN